MAFELSSSAFKPGDSIPRRYTCEGEDLSPPLHWTMPPAATKSFVIITDDPDAPVGTWAHWVIYDVPLDLRRLTEGVPTKDRLPNEALQGLNDFTRIGYGGPCPPPGKPHRYYFTLYQDAEKVRRPILFIWSIRSIWSVWFSWLVSFIQTYETDQIDQIDQTDWARSRASRSPEGMGLLCRSH